MSWMRAAIAVGGIWLVAGVTGMLVWIHDGSNYFGAAVALASAGFLTLVACVLTRVFGSSHGSQDDAFRRGRSMGYDAGFLEGRATARPVVVPLLRAVGRNQDIPASSLDAGDIDDVGDIGEGDIGAPTGVRRPDVRRAELRGAEVRGAEVRGADTRRAEVRRAEVRGADARGAEVRGAEVRGADARGVDAGRDDARRTARVDELRTRPTLMPAWRPEARDQVVGWERVVAWMGARRIPLLAGVLSLALVGVVVVGAMARTSVPVEALALPSGSLFHRTVPSQGPTPLLMGKPADSRASVAAAAGTTPLAPVKAGPSPVAPAPALGAKGAAVLASAPVALPGVAVAAPAIAAQGIAAQAIAYLPAVAQPATAPLAAPVVAPPAVPLTAAQQTAANALAAANLTAANASAAAALTASNAKAAADLTAANAAAAAAATAKAAAAAAWAVAHP